MTSVLPTYIHSKNRDPRGPTPMEMAMEKMDAHGSAVIHERT